MQEVYRNSRKRDFDTISDISSFETGSLAADEPLCGRCAGIDFNDILQKPIDQNSKECTSGEFLFHLGSTVDSKCPMCHLFWEMRLPEKSLKPPWTGAAVEYSVRAFSAVRLRLTDFRGTGAAKDTVMLGVIPTTMGNEKIHKYLPSSWNLMNETGYIYPIVQDMTDFTQQFSGNLIDPLKVDFDQLNRWIKFCQEKHLKFCGSIEETFLPGLQVIDCDTRKVIPASKGCTYVALSYVWGQVTKERGTTNGELPPVFANVIEDAITVVKKLNMKYLWVDRYCIPQDSDQKHDQIQSMDVVYKNAEVTIVALAGADPSVGLPGVGRRPRKQQPHIKIGEITLVSSLPSLQSAIVQSVWGTRGWTYQEGVMSRRRLIFTEYQVYFECMGMSCQESVITPLEVLHTRDMQAFKHSCHRLRAFPSHGVGRHSVGILKCIQDYAGRALTYDSDAINAFSGILRSYEKKKSPVSHFWGIPVFPTHRKQVQGSRYISMKPDIPGFQLALGMIWSTLEPARRRPGFPSWSWTGWAEVVGLRFSEQHGSTGHFWTGGRPDAVFWVELRSGKLVPWERFLDPFQYANNVRMASHFIHVEAWIVPVYLKYFPRWREIEDRGKADYTETWPEHKIDCWAARVGSDEKWWPVRMTRDLKMREEANEEINGGDFYEAMFLNGKRVYPSSEHLMILEQIDDHSERVGIACVRLCGGNPVEYNELERRRIRLG